MGEFSQQEFRHPHYGESYRTDALMAAVCGDHTSITQMLGDWIGWDTVVGYKKVLNEQELIMDAKSMVLLHACAHGSFEVAKMMIDTQQDLNSTMFYGGLRTCLQFAAKSGYTSILQLLLESGADQMTDNMHVPARIYERYGFLGLTPMALATTNGHIDCMQILADDGLKLTDFFMCRTLLVKALVGGHKSAVTLLISLGMDLNIRPQEDRDPTTSLGQKVLIGSIHACRIETIRFFLDFGFHMNWHRKKFHPLWTANVRHRDGLANLGITNSSSGNSLKEAEVFWDSVHSGIYTDEPRKLPSRLFGPEDWWGRDF